MKMRKLADTIVLNLTLMVLCTAVPAIGGSPREVSPPSEIILVDNSEPPLSGVILQIENDLWGGSDENYTSGLRVVYANALRMGADMETYSLAQKIFTPADIYAEEYNEDDRPYSGYLHLGYGLHNLDGSRMRNSFGIDLGMVGPSSLGEAAQKAYHDVKDIDPPRGWDEQIKDEPILQLSYEGQLRPWLEAPGGSGWDTDHLVFGAVALGNGFTHVEAGTEYRAGWNLAPRWATSLVSPGMAATSPLPWAEGTAGDPRVRVEVFAGGRGRLVARDITLDGNTFRDSRSVDRNMAVADLYVGAGWGLGWFSMTFTESYRTPEFDGQDGGQFFGSLTLNISF